MVWVLVFDVKGWRAGVWVVQGGWGQLGARGEGEEWECLVLMEEGGGEGVVAESGSSEEVREDHQN